MLTLLNSAENKGSWVKFIVELPTWKFSPLTKAGQQELPSRPDIVILTVCIQGKAFFISTVSNRLIFISAGLLHMCSGIGLTICMSIAA